MKLQTLFEEKKVVFSLEIFPPKKTSSIQTIYDTLDALRDIEPDFISVTYGAGGNPADRSTVQIARPAGTPPLGQPARGAGSGGRGRPADTKRPPAVHR